MSRGACSSAASASIGIDNLNPYYDPRLKEDRLDELRKLNAGDVRLPQGRLRRPRGARARARRRSNSTASSISARRPACAIRSTTRAPMSTANLVGHLNLLETRARRGGSSHFVYASSSSVYGGNTSAAVPRRGPGRSPDLALCRDQEGGRADERDLRPSLPAADDRACASSPSTAPGDGPDMAMWIFTRKILAGEPIQVFNHGRMRRDFTYIDDIVAGVVACLDTSAGRRRRGQAGRQPGAAPALQYRQQPLGGADADDRADRSRPAAARPRSNCCRCSPATSPRPSPTSSAIRRDLGFEPTTRDRGRHPALRRLVQKLYQALDGVTGAPAPPSCIRGFVLHLFWQ